MGVLITKSDIANQWRGYEAAQRAALEATGAFERACNGRKPSAECQRLWRLVGEAEAGLERAWQAYKKIAPAKLKTR